jgi:hypothetical protein
VLKNAGEGIKRFQLITYLIQEECYVAFAVGVVKLK